MMLRFTKPFTILIMFLIGIQVFGQEILLEQFADLRYGFNDKRESFQLRNNVNDDIALFLFDNKSIHAILYDKNFKSKANIKTDRQHKKYPILLGGNISGNSCFLLFTNEKFKKFSAKVFDFDRKDCDEKVIPIDCKKEKYLETFNFNDRLYLLTVKKKSSILKVYLFKDYKTEFTKELDFSDYKFSDYAEHGNIQLYNVLGKLTANLTHKLSVQEIDYASPNSIAAATEISKLYCFQNKLFFTLDYEFAKTRLITIDLKDYSFQMNTYEHGQILCKETDFASSNSFLIDNYLFQIIACDSELKISVLNLKMDSVIRDFVIKKDQAVSFMNTPIYLEYKTDMLETGKEKELDKINRFLRKISRWNVGVTAYKRGDIYECLIGGAEEYPESFVGGGTAGPSTPNTTTVNTMHGPQTIVTGYNHSPTFSNYQSYIFTKSVYFRSLFNTKTLEHEKGRIALNAFDKIKNFSDKLENISLPTIFKVDDYYVFGYYKDDLKKYYLRKFEDSHMPQTEQ